MKGGAKVSGCLRGLRQPENMERVDEVRGSILKNAGYDWLLAF